MPVLIDGNNLLFAAQAAGDPDHRLGRDGLCAALSAWALRMRQRVRVVFDGPAPSEGFQAQLARDAVEVSFSGAGVSADEALIDLLARDSAARRIAVVSSDREIARAARRRRARPMKSEAFWARLQDDLQRPARLPNPEPREKRAGLSANATDHWLRELGLE